MNRFTILKTSWGIAIFYNIKELLNFEKDDNDTYEVYPLIFLKMNEKVIDEVSLKYLIKGVKSVVQYVKISPICFSIESLDYNFCDYQPEGMYYMFRKWFFENHNMEVPSINVYYNNELNKYVFPDLE